MGVGIVTILGVAFAAVTWLIGQIPAAWLSDGALLALAGLLSIVLLVRRHRQAKDLGKLLVVEQLPRLMLIEIERERRNFEHMRDARPYRGEPHRKAVEDQSLTDLSWMLGQLIIARWNKRLCRRVKSEIETIQAMPARQKDVSKFLPLLAKLEAKLARFVHRAEPVHDLSDLQ